jgi:hypothetical protein
LSWTPKKTVTTTEIIDKNWKNIGRISAMSIAKQLGVSRVRFGSIAHEDAEAVRKVSPEIPERGSKTSTVLVF